MKLYGKFQTTFALLLGSVGLGLAAYSAWSGEPVHWPGMAVGGVAALIAGFAAR